MARLPPLGLAVFHLYESPDSPMTLRSDTLLRLSSRGVAARALDPLPVRSQQSDSHTFYISSQSLTLGFSGTTGLLEVRSFLFIYFCPLPKISVLILSCKFPLQSIRRKDDSQEVKVQMQFMMYGTRPSKDKSGAYLFLPDGTAKVFPQPLCLRCLPASQVSHGYSCITLGCPRQASGRFSCCLIFVLILIVLTHFEL